MKQKILQIALITILLLSSHITHSRELDRVSQLTPLHKGEYVASLTASFGDFNSTNSSFMLLLDNLDVNGSISSVKPSVGYFYSDRSMVGARFNYTSARGEIASASLDMGSVNDLILDIPQVAISSKSYAYGVYHRSYTKIDKKGQFELFSEIEALCGYGSYEIAQDITGEDDFLRSNTSKFSIEFNPGIAVNITPNVATFVSFGLGGLSFSKVEQYNAEGEYIGMRRASQFNLNLDLFAINFGLTFHFWNK
ncbi:MAG: hypothetical protein R3Y08_06845 [Rikenellaceae bacterium]